MVLQTSLSRRTTISIVLCVCVFNGITINPKRVAVHEEVKVKQKQTIKAIQTTCSISQVNNDNNSNNTNLTKCRKYNIHYASASIKLFWAVVFFWLAINCFCSMFQAPTGSHCEDSLEVCVAYARQVHINWHFYRVWLPGSAKIITETKAVDWRDRFHSNHFCLYSVFLIFMLAQSYILPSFCSQSNYIVCRFVHFIIARIALNYSHSSVGWSLFGFILFRGQFRFVQRFLLTYSMHRFCGIPVDIAWSKERFTRPKPRM